MRFPLRWMPVICGLLISLVVLAQAAGAASDNPPSAQERADRSSLPGLPHLPVAPLTSRAADQVADGAYHTCAVSANGGVSCWGNNDRGQLGDNTLTSRLAPVEVIGLSSGVLAVAAGYMHTCALMESGGVKCWGFNRFGQLGNGEMFGRRKPVDVVGLQSGVIAIAAGGYHTCALTTGKGVKCWGYNQFGQLGDGTHKDSSLPVDVARLSSGVFAIGAGSWHTCSLSGIGEARCWGANASGQLGDGTQEDRRTPVKVVGLDGPQSSMAAGSLHTCALSASGAVQCWGANDSGQLGDGTRLDHLEPVSVSGLGTGASGLAAGEYHTCARLAAGDLRCWGDNHSGQLGDASFEDRLAPVAVVGLSEEVLVVTAGAAHTCSLMESKALLCWGNNAYGQVGRGIALNRPEPVEVHSLSGDLEGLAAGLAHSCALSTSRGAWCWGANPYGQIGDGTKTIRLEPVDVVGLSSGIQYLTAGGTHTCALNELGGVSCWGNNWSGQLGDGTLTDRTSPVVVENLASRVIALTAGVSHTCALTDQGGLLCWGHNWSGQLGDGTDQNRPLPVAVIGLSDGVRAVTAGGYHTCALLESSGVMCWGGNSAGQLGDGSTTDRYLPVAVVGLSGNVRAVSAGAFHTCALLESGDLQCWGENTFGQLGDGTTLDRLKPVGVVGLWAKARGLAAGSAHTCALTRRGGIKCWGDNSYGQLGDGSFDSSILPVNVVGLTSGVRDLAAGYAHTCVLPGEGGMRCWGHNSHGQLGDGSASLYPFPVGVLGFEGRDQVWLPLIQH